MQGKLKRSLALLLVLSLLLSVSVLPVSASDDVAYTDLSGVTWNYASGKLQSIQDGNQTVENGKALLISDSVQGQTVTAVQSNGFDNVVVGHKNNQYILLPSGIETVSAKAFYDFNYVKAVSFPATVTDVNFNAFDVLGREINNATVIYGSLGSAAESWAENNSTAVYSFTAVEQDNFQASASEGGFIHPSGSYYVPDSMKQEGVQYAFSVESDAGYAIEHLMVDGSEIQEAAGKASYLLYYTFSEQSAEITVSFSFTGEETEEAVAEETAEAIVLDPVTVTEGELVSVDLGLSIQDNRIPDAAVAEGMDLSDAYDEVPADTSGYTASMGISTGDYYAADGVVYEMVFGTNGTGENGDLGIVFYNKAQVINYLYDTYGWVYGEDYNLIRMFHYDASVTSGNRKGAYDFHCAFVYKALEEQDSYDGLSGEEAFYSENDKTEGITNYGTLFVQGQPENAGTYVIENLQALCSTRPDGPQEATNFYGLGSAIVVDGGTPSKDDGYAEQIFDEEDTTVVELIDPYIDGGANPIYALASSLVKIKGGVLFTGFSGGHGPYSSLQGQITINTDENIVAEDGTINTDVETLTKTVLTERPGRFGWAVRNTDENGDPIAANDYSTLHAKLELDEDAIEDYENENGDVTVVTTANSSGSLLVTDSGGGIIVANRFSGVAYSTGSSGVYSMGGGSYVYVYNSRLESHIEPALNSVGEGYIFAYNSEMSGPIGILSSGGDDHVHIYNSSISTELDFDMDFYDLTDPNDPEQLATYSQLLEDVDADELVNSNYLMIFPLNGDDMSNFVSNWYEDTTQVPGKNGGNIALISTTSPSGITVDSTKLSNNAYAAYRDSGVPNWLVAAAGGTSTISFRNQNSQTKWDLTGADDSTTELYGNLYCAAASGEGMWVTAAGAMVVNLENSEWTGSIENLGTGVTLNLDQDSVWTVTGTCTVSSLTLADGAQIEAPEGYTLNIDGKTELAPGTYENVNIQVLKDGALVYDGIYTEDKYSPSVEASDTDSGSSDAGMGGMPMGDMGGMPMGEGGMEGMPGGPNEGGASNCTHTENNTLVNLTWSAGDGTVAELDTSQRELQVRGLTAGETTLTVTALCADGSEQIISLDVTVTPAPVEEPENEEETVTPESFQETPVTETVTEPSDTNSPILIVIVCILVLGTAVGIVAIRKKRQ